MPIYEYTCRACGHEFEHLERGDDKAECPSCGGKRLAKRFSVPAAHSAGSTPASCPSGDAGMCDAPSCCGPGCNLADFG